MPWWVRQLVGAIVPDELNSPCPPGSLHLPTLRRLWRTVCPSGTLTVEDVRKLTQRHSVIMDLPIDPEGVWAELQDMMGGDADGDSSEGITLKHLQQ